MIYNYIKRLNYYKDFKSFLEYSKLNINYNNSSILYIIKNFNYESNDFKKDVLNYFKNIDLLNEKTFSFHTYLNFEDNIFF